MTDEENLLSPAFKSLLPNADMQATSRAMLRAARRAREIARETNTPLVIVHEGKLIELSPDEVDLLDSEQRTGALDSSLILVEMNPKRLLEKVAAGHQRNIRFRDFEALVAVFGFRLARTEGSHHIYLHDRIAEQLNLQEVAGEAKPYQIRQFLRLVERYDLRMKGGV